MIWVIGMQMDRASILGDAIEYLKELLQRISDIHNELEAAKLEQSRSLPSSPGRAQAGYPAAAVKEECPVLPNPENQPPRVSSPSISLSPAGYGGTIS